MTSYCVVQGIVQQEIGCAFRWGPFEESLVKHVGSLPGPRGRDIRATASPRPEEQQRGGSDQTPRGGQARWPPLQECVWSGSRRTADLRWTCWVGAGRRYSPTLDAHSLTFCPWPVPMLNPPRKRLSRKPSDAMQRPRLSAAGEEVLALCCRCGSSVAKSCLTFCNPVDHSSPGSSILHHLQESLTFAPIESQTQLLTKGHFSCLYSG